MAMIGLLPLQVSVTKLLLVNVSMTAMPDLFNDISWHLLCILAMLDHPLMAIWLVLPLCKAPSAHI